MSISTRTRDVPLTLELNPIDTPFKQYAYEQIRQHNEDYTPCVFKHLPMLTDIDELCTFGVFTRTLMRSKKQYLMESATINIGGALSTITALSRLYLDYYHPHKLRAFGALTRATYQLPQRPPLYVDPTIMQHASYVDIKSMYFSILNQVGWDISYWSEHHLTTGRKPLDFPLKQCKPARSYLVTGSLKSAVGIWTGQKTYWRKTHNKHINYELWGYVQSVLHSIAQYAVLYCKAAYVHTDGYIVPDEYVQDLIQHISMYGLSAEVKTTGATYICGFANYMCGEKHTKVFNPAKLQRKQDKIRWDIPRLWVRDITNQVVTQNSTDSRQKFVLW